MNAGAYTPACLRRLRWPASAGCAALLATLATLAAGAPAALDAAGGWLAGAAMLLAVLGLSGWLAGQDVRR